MAGVRLALAVATAGLGAAAPLGCTSAPALGQDPSAAAGSAVTGPSAEASDAAVDGATSSTRGDDDAQGSTTGAEAASPRIPRFTEVSAAAGVDVVHGAFEQVDCLVPVPDVPGQTACLHQHMVGAAAVGDLNADDRNDLVMTRLHGGPVLLLDAGDGTFSAAGDSAGIDLDAATAGVAVADLDNDGDQDIYLLTVGGERHHLYMGDGAGRFVEEAVPRGADLSKGTATVATSVAVGDYDLDGYLDIYTAEWRPRSLFGPDPSRNRLLRNRGAVAPGFFEDVTDAAGVRLEHVWAEAGADEGAWAFAPAFADLDGDDWPELLVTSDYGCSRLYWNRGDGTFEDGTATAGVGTDRNGMGSTLGDVDNDGDLDWFVTAIAARTGNRLFENNGDRTFTDVTGVADVRDAGWGWGTVAFDANNDEHLDLLAVAGWRVEGDPGLRRLWLGAHVWPMPEVARASGLGYAPRDGRGVVTFDYEGDGDLDLFIVNSADRAQLFRNDEGTQLASLRVRAVGTTSNADGIGARVTVRRTLRGPEQVREIGSASHYQGMSERVAHFGLGESQRRVAQVRVDWPVTGRQQVFEDVAPGLLVVIEP